MMSETSSLEEMIMIMVSMGFQREDCHAAIEEGKLSVSDAVDWIIAGKPRAGGAAPGVLRLSNTGNRHADIGSNPFRNPQQLPNSPEPTSQANVQSPDLEVPEQTVKSRTACNAQQREIKQKFEERQRKDAERIAREEKLAKRKAREEVLKQIQEDRDSCKLRKGPAASTSHSGSTISSSNSTEDTAQSETSAAAVATPGPSQEKKTTLIQIRVDNGKVIRQHFDFESPLNAVWDFVKASTAQDMEECILIQPFPRHEYNEEEMIKSLVDLKLVPNGSLILSKKLKGEPFQKPASAENSSRSKVSVPPPPQTMQVPMDYEEAAVSSDEEQEEAMTEDSDEDFFPAPPPELGLPQQFVGGQGLGGMGRGRGRGMGPDPMAHFMGLGPGGLGLGRGAGGHVGLGGFGQGQGAGGHGILDAHVFEGPGQMLGAQPWNDEPLPHHNQDPKQLAAAAASRRRVQNPPSAPPVPEVQPLQPVPRLTHMLLEAVCQRMTDPQQAPYFSLQGLPSEVAMKIVEHLIKVECLRPKTLQPFLSCHLNRLDLAGYHYTTNELLTSISAHTFLLQLNLAGCPLISDTGLLELQYLKRLKVLRISDNKQITDRTMETVQELKTLQVLLLDGTGVTDSGVITYLNSSPLKLEQLDLSRTEITHRILPSMQHVPNLRILNLEATKVLSLTGIQSLQSLSALDISYTGVVTESLMCLQNLRSLTALNLTSTNNINGDTALQYLADLPLETLQLPSRSTTTDVGLSYISGMPLRILDLTNYNTITDAGMMSVAKITTLKKLRLSNTKLSNQGLHQLTSLKDLEELALDRVAITDEAVADIASFSYLRELSLAETLITDEFLTCEQLNKLFSLNKLNLSRTSVTSEGMTCLKLPSLTSLNVDLTFVTEALCLELQNSPNLPKLQSLVFNRSGELLQ